MAHRPGMYFYPSLPCPGRDHHCPFSQPQDPLNTGLGCHNQLSGVDLSVDTYSVVTGRRGLTCVGNGAFPPQTKHILLYKPMEAGEISQYERFEDSATHQ